MGARIEILSHPLTIYSQIVAPLVGARIEICNIDRCNMQILVAPLVGARIEIRICKANATVATSLPSWERGLKYEFINGTEI